MTKGDLVHHIYLECGHMDTVTQINAAHRPMWMLSAPEIGAVGECPWCKEDKKVVNVKLVQGWGD